MEVTGVNLESQLFGQIVVLIYPTQWGYFVPALPFMKHLLKHDVDPVTLQNRVNSDPQYTDRKYNFSDMEEYNPMFSHDAISKLCVEFLGRDNGEEWFNGQYNAILTKISKHLVLDQAFDATQPVVEFKK